MSQIGSRVLSISQIVQHDFEGGFGANKCKRVILSDFQWDADIAKQDERGA